MRVFLQVRLAPDPSFCIPGLEVVASMEVIGLEVAYQHLVKSLGFLQSVVTTRTNGRGNSFLSGFKLTKTDPS
jgi:hypothetical protein